MWHLWRIIWIQSNQIDSTTFRTLPHNNLWNIFIYVFCESTSSVTGWLQLRSVVWFKLDQQHFQPTLLATSRIFSECLENQLLMWWVDFSCGEWSELSEIKSITGHFETSLAANCRIYCEWTSSITGRLQLRQVVWYQLNQVDLTTSLALLFSHLRKIL